MSASVTSMGGGSATADSGEGATTDSVSASQNTRTLPPAATRGLLALGKYSTIESLKSRGIITAAQGGYSTVSGSAVSRIGSQHNGDVYQLGNVEISEQRAKSTTVYDLARLSRTLALHNA